MNQIKSSIKVLAIILVMMVSVNKVQSQVSIGVPVPSGSAMLDVSSTTKGFLPPRMSEIQRVLILKPDAGLIVYQTDGKKGIYYYDGSSWTYVMSQFNAITPNETVVAIGGGANDGIATYGTVAKAPTPVYVTSEWLNVGGYSVYLKNKRMIYGNDFDGTAALTSNLLSAGITSSTTLAVGGASTLSGNLTVSGTTTLNGLIVNGTITGSMTGNASTATKLATARNINGVAFDGSSDITVIANAGTLTGTVLKSTITGSSLTSVGTITSGVWSGTAVAVSNGGTGLTSAGLNGQILTSTGNGTLTWTTFSNGTHYIGETFGGGIVFYVYDEGKHGLIAATNDQSSGIKFHNGPNTITRARADGIGAGLNNTTIIIAYQGHYDGSSFASTICNEYSVTETKNGISTTYGGWYLPSKYELNLLYLKKDVVAGFANSNYWSSTEYLNPLHPDWGTTWYQNFSNGDQLVNTPSAFYLECSVRAIRAF